MYKGCNKEFTINGIKHFYNNKSDDFINNLYIKIFVNLIFQ